MAKFYQELNEDLIAFIQAQKVFFVATAPVEGRINLSPKGMNTLRCFDFKTVAYLDITGSGNETAAHLKQNGRLTMMFCSFTETPLVLRLSGLGRAIQPRHEAAWAELYGHFEPVPGPRQIIILDINLVQTSCGFGVPLYEFKAERPTLRRSNETKSEAKLAAYREKHNQFSIDGLPTGLLMD